MWCLPLGSWRAVAFGPWWVPSPRSGGSAGAGWMEGRGMECSGSIGTAAAAEALSVGCPAQAQPSLPPSAQQTTVQPLFQTSPGGGAWEAGQWKWTQGWEVLAGDLRLARGPREYHLVPSSTTWYPVPPRQVSRQPRGMSLGRLGPSRAGGSGPGLGSGQPRLALCSWAPSSEHWP